MHGLAQWHMIQHRLFDSEPIGNVFYLQADVSIEIYKLLLLFSIYLHD